MCAYMCSFPDIPTQLSFRVMILPSWVSSPPPHFQPIQPLILRRPSYYSTFVSDHPFILVYQTHLIPRYELRPTLVPSEDPDGGAVNGGLLKELVLVVIVRGHLPAPPPDGQDLLLLVPLHTLHHRGTVNGCIFQHLPLQTYIQIMEWRPRH